MSFDEEFGKIYENDYKLPDRIMEEYSIFSCLKYTEERQVFLLLDRDKRKYILKAGNGENADRLENEYHIASYIRGMCGSDEFPYPVLFFREGTFAYYIREYKEGKTLRDKVEKEGPYSEPEALLAVYSLCGTLEKLHSLPDKMICRDIKPDNIIVSPDGRLLLIDLDAARTVKDDRDNDTVCLGTRATAAPEQFGYGQTNERTDVYAVGMLLTYIMTGGYDSSAVKRGKAAMVIRRATRFDPDKRYPDMRSMQKALRAGSRIRYAAVPVCIAAAAVSAGAFMLPRQLSGFYADESVEAMPVMQFVETTGITAGKTAQTDNDILVTEAESTVASPDPASADISAYLQYNPGWIAGDDGSFSYRCDSDRDSINFVFPAEYFVPEDIRSAAVMVSTTGEEIWACLTAPDLNGEWFCSTAMDITERMERVIFEMPDGISDELLLSLNELKEGCVITVSDIYLSNKDYEGPDIWVDNGDGSYTFTKDTLDSLSLPIVSDIDPAEADYIYADICAEGEILCGVGGFNEDGFTYCDGKNITDGSRRVCWDLKNGTSAGRITRDMAFVCYFLSDELTVTIKNIVLTKEHDNIG